MFAAQVGVRGCADRRILRRDGTATEEIASAVLLGVISDALPEQAEDNEVTVLSMDARSPQFDHFRAQRLEYVELKLLGRVITQLLRRVGSGLQSVRANKLARSQVLNDKMIANGVERIFIQPSGVRLFKPFVQFEVEDLVA